METKGSCKIEWFAWHGQTMLFLAQLIGQFVINSDIN